MSESQWASFTDALSRYFPKAVFLITGHALDQRDQVFASSGLGQEWLERYKTEFTGQNEVVRAAQRFPTGQVFSHFALFSNGSFQETEVFRNWLQPQGLDSIAGLVIAQGGGRSLIWTAYFADEPDNRLYKSLHALLTLLAPHIVRATDHYKTLHVTRTIASEFSGLMDSLIISSIVTDENGQFLIANSAGDSLLQAAHSLSVDKRGLIALPDAEDTALLRQRIKSSASSLLPSGLRCHSGEAFQSIRIVPFRSSITRNRAMQNLLYESQPRVALFVGQKEAFLVDDSILLEVFQLTRTEAEICRMLLAMQTPTEIASQQNKSLRTVRNQIQAIYTKLDISRHAELSDALAVFKLIGKLH